MSLKNKLFGGLIYSSIILNQFNVQGEEKFKHFEAWNYGKSSEERINYWVLEGDSSTLPFLKPGEAYVLQEKYPTVFLTPQFYCKDGEIQIATNNAVLKNIGKVQPNTTFASYEIFLSSKVNSTNRQLELKLILEGNEPFYDIYEKLNVYATPLNLPEFPISNIERNITQTEWIKTPRNTFKKEIEVVATGGLEFRPQKENYWQSVDLTNLCIFSIQPLRFKMSEQKKESKELQKLFKAEQGKPQCRKVE